MKLGFVKAVMENPESDQFYLSMKRSAFSAAYLNREFMRNPDDTDAAIMRLMTKNEDYKQAMRRHHNV